MCSRRVDAAARRTQSLPRTFPIAMTAPNATRDRSLPRKTAMLIAIVSLALAFARPVAAATWTTYDASLGTLPEAQGWVRTDDISPPGPYVVEMVPGDLHLSTLGLQATGASGGGVYWEHTAPGLDFTSEFTVEADLRIASSPDHTINLTSGWPRSGYYLAVTDANGRVFWVAFGSHEIALSNTFFGAYGSPNTVILSLDTTDRHHLYRLQRAPSGGATLLVDGVPALSMSNSTPGAPGTTPSVVFGDGTYWANSDSYLASVRFALATLAADPLEPRRSLWAAPQSNPARALRIAFHAEAAGNLELACFDVAGRQVSREVRSVAAGERGTMAVAGAREAGLYLYRMRLRTSAGTLEQAGRALVVR